MWKGKGGRGAKFAPTKKKIIAPTKPFVLMVALLPQVRQLKKCPEHTSASF